MKPHVAIGALGLGLMLSPLLTSMGRTAVPASPKIGVIDLDNTLSSTPAGKRANDAFEKTRKTKQTQLDKDQDDLKRAAADLEKQKAVLKPDAYAAKRDELEKKFMALQGTLQKLEKDLAGERQQLMAGLLKQAQPLVEKLAKAEGVTIIVDRQSVVWADPAADLTPKLNADMK
jgi:outer membrane protein